MYFKFTFDSALRVLQSQLRFLYDHRNVSSSASSTLDFKQWVMEKCFLTSNKYNSIFGSQAEKVKPEEESLMVNLQCLLNLD